MADNRRIVYLTYDMTLGAMVVNGSTLYAHGSLPSLYAGESAVFRLTIVSNGEAVSLPAGGEYRFAADAAYGQSDPAVIAWSSQFNNPADWSDVSPAAGKVCWRVDADDSDVWSDIGTASSVTYHFTTWFRPSSTGSWTVVAAGDLTVKAVVQPPGDIDEQSSESTDSSTAAMSTSSGSSASSASSLSSSSASSESSSSLSSSSDSSSLSSEAAASVEYVVSGAGEAGVDATYAHYAYGQVNGREAWAGGIGILMWSGSHWEIRAGDQSTVYYYQDGVQDGVPAASGTWLSADAGFDPPPTVVQRVEDSSSSSSP